jgi:trk system potassium uptake protein TrkH
MSKFNSSKSQKRSLKVSHRQQRMVRIMTSTRSKNSRQMPVALQLVLGLMALVIIGTALLMIPGAATRRLSFVEALFTATSAAAVTGLSLFPVSTDLTLWGQLILLLLVQIGGVGLVVVVVLVFRLIGRHVKLGERLAVASSLGLDRPEEIALIMVRAIGLMLTIEAVGASLLFLHWRISGIVPPGKAAYYAIFHAVTAYCNAGFDLFYGLPDYPNGLPTDPLSLIIMGGLIILGGLGIPIYMDLIYRHRPFSLHTRLTISISVALILLGWIGLLISEYQQTGVLSAMPFSQRAILAWFQSVSARTAGFPGLPGFSEINFPTILMLIFLMFIGTAPASTGGGITTGTFVVLWLAVLSYARGLDKIRIGKHTLPGALLMRSLVVLVISLSLVILATWLLLLTNPFSLDQSLFEVVSAYSTTGLSLGITTQLNTIGRLIIIFTMFAGRLGAITIMISLLGHDPKNKLVDYPEESILIG